MCLGDPYPLRDFIEPGEANDSDTLERRRTDCLRRKEAGTRMIPWNGDRCVPNDWNATPVLMQDGTFRMPPQTIRGVNFSGVKAYYAVIEKPVKPLGCVAGTASGTAMCSEARTGNCIHPHCEVEIQRKSHNHIS